MDEAHPSGLRLGIGLLLAALAATLTFILGSMSGVPAEALFRLSAFTFLFGLPVALAHAVLLGLPAYLALRRRWPLRRWSAALGGFVIGVMPVVLLTLTLGVGRSAPDGAFFEDGRHAVEMWLGLLETTVLAGASGMAGGLAFWLTVRRREA